MTEVQIIYQLETLIEDAESHRNSDGTLDDVFQKDVEALRFAIVEVKRRSVSLFCSLYQKCRDCPLERVRCECCCYDMADESELDVILQAIRDRSKAMTELIFWSVGIVAALLATVIVLVCLIVSDDRRE